MDLAALTAKASEALAGGSDFNKTVKFDFGDVGKLFVDGAANTATNEDGDADATIKLDWADFEALAKGDLDPTMAFMQGKLKILGDMSVAMGLKDLLAKLM